MTNEQNAERLANAIRQFAEHPERLENFQAYLERHFTSWMQKWAADMMQALYKNVDMILKTA